MKNVLCFSMLFLLLAAGIAPAQQGLPPLSESAQWASTVSDQYQVFSDLIYGSANNYQLKLDVWQRKNQAAPVPTLIYYHGGGWVGGDRAGAVAFFLPFLEMGWNIVNVDYRLAGVSLAPAAVEDCRCALRWVMENAKRYNVDTNKIVLSGHSAGGHLSLITGMLPSGTALDNQCYGEQELKVAAIVNWYGISDVGDLLSAPNLKNYAVMWMGSRPDAQAIAKTVSPLSYVRRGLPPIITIHGDADPVVPYSHAVRLHEALGKAGVPNELVTVPGGGHGQFTPEQVKNAYSHVRAFLKQNGVMP
jgi:acetyl esterase/lipase